MNLAYRRWPGQWEERSVERPLVAVTMQGLPEVAVTCLVDSGAIGNRLSADLAEAAGLDLSDIEYETVGIGAGQWRGRTLSVELTFEGQTWTAPVTFIDNWPMGYGVLGQEGFFRVFDICFQGTEQTFDVEWAGRG